MLGCVPQHFRVCSVNVLDMCRELSGRVRNTSGCVPRHFRAVNDRMGLGSQQSGGYIGTEFVVFDRCVGRNTYEFVCLI